MGPNGLPGPPGVKVSLLHLSALPVTACTLKFFLLAGQSHEKFVFHRVIKESQVLVSR